jgi:uncharacterized protein (DUF433 family)
MTTDPTTPQPAALCEATVHGREGGPEPCGRERPCPVHDTGVPELIAELGHWGANQPDQPPRGAPPAAVPNPPPTGPAILGRAREMIRARLAADPDLGHQHGFVDILADVAARAVAPLLVDPRAARVLDAARAWRQACRDGDDPALWADGTDLALIAAVDALGGSLQRNLNPGGDGPSKPPSDLNPAEPATANLVTTSRGLAVPTPTTGGPDHDGLTGRPIASTSQRYMCKRCGRSGGELTENGCPVHGSASVGMHNDPLDGPAEEALADRPAEVRHSIAGDPRPPMTTAEFDAYLAAQPTPSSTDEGGTQPAGVANSEAASLRDMAERREALISQHRRYMESCIWVDPGRMSGAPCLGGTRIRVDTIAGLLADGLSGDQIRDLYPDVTDRHLVAVQHFVAEVDAGSCPEDELADGQRAIYDHVVGAHGPSDAEPAPAPVAHLSVADLADDCHERHTTTGVPAWAALAWLVDAAVRAPVGDRGEGLVGQVIAAGERIMGALAAEPAPEPAGGPGWDRETVGALAAGLAGESVAADLVSPERGQALRDQVLALLADRDRLAELAERRGRRAQHERDIADRRQAERGAARDELADVREELARMAGDVTDLRATVAMRDSQLRDVRAELEYVRADREGLDLQRNRLLAERGGARLDAAADALEEAANDASVLLESGARAFTARGLRARADIIRADGRPVPGSPQPAPAGGEEPDHA